MLAFSGADVPLGTLPLSLSRLPSTAPSCGIATPQGVLVCTSSSSTVSPLSKPRRFASRPGLRDAVGGGLDHDACHKIPNSGNGLPPACSPRRPSGTPGD